MHIPQPGGHGRAEAGMASTMKWQAYRLDTLASTAVVGVTIRTEARRPGMQQLDQKQMLMARPGFALHRSSSKDSKPEEYHLPQLSFKDHQSEA